VLDVRTIYAEPAALELERGRQVVGRWPRAEVIEVPSAARVEVCTTTRPASSAGSG
jgi:hypothetical protein